MALLSRFFGRTASEGAAYAFGVATGPVLAPATEQIRQEAWDHYRTRIPGVASLAAGVAQGQVDEATARDWAHRQGFSDAAFSALVDIANIGPDVGMAMQAWRRRKLTEEQFRTVLRRQGIEEQWDGAIEALKVELLAPADLARAIHRGLIPDPGLLQGELPRRQGNVPAYPVYPIDALEEAEAFGYDHDRLGVLVGLQGLPMGSHEAAQALFRGVLTPDDYLRAIAEGNTRNEWADAIREQSRAIPSSGNYVAAFIRGWIDRAKMHAGAARHGMTPDDADLLALISGRPVTTRQAFIGFIRGGRVAGQSWDERETFRRAVIQSNIRPEWEPILWAQRYTYPPLFQTVRLLSSGVITPAIARDWMKRSGYAPDVIDAVVSGSSGASGSGGAKELTVAQLRADFEGGYLSESDLRARLAELGYSAEAVQQYVTLGEATRVKRYRDAGVTLLNRRYLHHQIDDLTTRTLLSEYGVTAGGIERILAVWDLQRQTARSELTAAQIKKAYRKAILTREEAIGELVDREYTAADAATLLDE